MKDLNHRSGRKAITAVALIFTLLTVTVLGSGAITMEAYGASSSVDPFHVKAAPHFRDVIYSLSQPTYLQRFDGLGSWKVSAGSPTIGGLSDSTLTIKSPSTVPCELTLAKSDAPGMVTDDRTYVESRMAASSASAYINVTLENVTTGYVATISIHGGLVTYYCDISTGGTTTGTLYGSAATSTYYKVAFDLDPVGITFYVYSGTGVALGNHYVNNARLGAGDVGEIHLGVSAASATGTWDYIYVTDETPLAMESTTDVAIDTMVADSSVTNKAVKVDPTAMKITKSSNSDVSGAFGIVSSSDTDYNLTSAMHDFGTSAESSQRIQGKQYAEGWDNFRSDTENAVRSVIAEDKGITSDQVYLVDYYIDYIQQETTFDQQIVTRQHDLYLSMFREALRFEGYTDAKLNSLAGSAPVSQLSINVPFALTVQQSWTLTTSSDGDAQWYDWALGIVSPLGGALDLARLTAIGMKGAVDDTVDKALNTFSPDAIANATMKVIGPALNALMAAGMSFSDALSSLANSTTEGFQAISSGLTSAMTMMTAQTNEMIGNLSQSWSDRLGDMSNLTGSFMTWSQQQAEMTNAMFSQMFLGMQEQSAEMYRMFAGQLAATNAAVMNITNGIFSGGDLSDILSGGKTSDSTPLTISGIFGSGWTSNPIVIIILVAIVLIIVVAIVLVWKNNHKGRRYR